MPVSIAVRGRRPAPATLALATLCLVSAVVLLYAGRHLTFFYDEWDFIRYRRGGSVGAYLDPHNGHLSLFPVIIYKLLFKLVGLRHYTPYRAVVVALHILCACLLYVLVRRRIGPWLALAPTTLLLFMGTAWQDLLWPFQIGFLSSVAGGLGALVLLERRERRADAFAAALLIWSVGSSGVGIPFLVACAVALIAQGRPFQRLWVVAVPLALFAVWYLGWGSSEQITSDTILGAPQYIADAAAGAVGGIAGLSSTWGPPLTIAALAAAMVGLRRRGGGPTPLLLAAAVGALAFWGLDALIRSSGPDPTASRYLYIGAVFVILIGAEAAAGVVLGRAGLAVGALLVAGALIANVNVLRMGEGGLRVTDDSVRSSLAVVEIAAPVISPAFAPSPEDIPGLTAGAYLAAVRALGSPALTVPELAEEPNSLRAQSDALLASAERLAPVPAAQKLAGTQPVTVLEAAGGRLSRHGLCDSFHPTAVGEFLDLGVPSGTELLFGTAGSPGASISVRRFATVFGPELATTAGGANWLIRFPADRAPEYRWVVRLTSARPIYACIA